MHKTLLQNFAQNSNNLKTFLKYLPLNSSYVAQLRSTTTSSKKDKVISISNMNTDGMTVNNPASLDFTFENTQAAYKCRSITELLRAYTVYQLCSIRLLVKHQFQIIRISRKVLGKHLFNLIMKSTFYGHFVAGEEANEIRRNVMKLESMGAKSMLSYSAEEDLHSSAQELKDKDANTQQTVQTKKIHFHPLEVKWDLNNSQFLKCVNTAAEVSAKDAIMAIKVTCLIRPEVLLKFSSFVTEIGHKKAFYDKHMFAWKLMISKTPKEMADMLNELKFENIEFSVNEAGELINYFIRLDNLFKYAEKKNVRIFVDAEQTYFQAAINQTVIELMRHFNRNKCLVLNTYQNYLKQTFDRIRHDLDMALEEGFYFGAKFVRGAYMEQERQRAKDMGYEDPINENFEATTKTYEKSFMHCFEKIKQNQKGKITLVAASHNEVTIRFVAEKMKEHDIKPSDNVILFGQVYGMCDYITFNLCSMGYPVIKATPYGPLGEVLPYLSRRVNENQGIFDKVKKEKRLLATEIGRRLKSFEFS